MQFAFITKSIIFEFGYTYVFQTTVSKLIEWKGHHQVIRKRALPPFGNKLWTKITFKSGRLSPL